MDEIVVTAKRIPLPDLGDYGLSLISNYGLGGVSGVSGGVGGGSGGGRASNSGGPGAGAGDENACAFTDVRCRATVAGVFSNLRVIFYAKRLVTISGSRLGGLAGGGASQSGRQRDLNPSFDEAVGQAIRRVSLELSAVNDRSGLLYNRDRANRPLGSVVSEKRVGIPFINRRTVFVSSPPNQFVPDGLDFMPDGFIGGLYPIRDAAAVVVGYSYLTRAESLPQLRPALERLARDSGGPVFVFFTRRGFHGPFRIDPGTGE